jgi:hypothetical protein
MWLIKFAGFDSNIVEETLRGHSDRNQVYAYSTFLFILSLTSFVCISMGLYIQTDLFFLSVIIGFIYTALHINAYRFVLHSISWYQYQEGDGSLNYFDERRYDISPPLTQSKCIYIFVNIVFGLCVSYYTALCIHYVFTGENTLFSQYSTNQKIGNNIIVLLVQLFYSSAIIIRLFKKELSYLEYDNQRTLRDEDLIRKRHKLAIERIREIRKGFGINSDKIYYDIMVDTPFDQRLKPKFYIKKKLNLYKFLDYFDSSDEEKQKIIEGNRPIESIIDDITPPGA